MTHHPRREPTRIGLARLSQSSAATIGMAIERFARNEFAIVEPEEAQLLIVDADRLVGADNLEGLRAKHPALPLILLGSRDAHHDNAVTLRKPIGVQALLDALRSLKVSSAVTARPASAQAAVSPAAPLPAAPAVEVHAARQASHAAHEAAKAADHGRHQSAHAHRVQRQRPAPRPDAEEDCCGAGADLPPSHQCTAADIARAYFDDTAGLLGTMRSAARHGLGQRKAITVTGLPHALYIDAAQPAGVITDLDDEVLRGACDPAKAAALQFYTIAAVPQSVRGWRRVDAERFLWKLALWTSAGRLPKGLDLDARVRLTAWPNFTRLTLTPHALRIAALWVTRHLSPLELAARLQIPQRYVFTLYAAAHVAGMIEPLPAAAVPAAPLPEAAPAPVAARGLLKRILGKFLNAR